MANRAAADDESALLSVAPQTTGSGSSSTHNSGTNGPSVYRPKGGGGGGHRGGGGKGRHGNGGRGRGRQSGGRGFASHPQHGSSFPTSWHPGTPQGWYGWAWQQPWASPPCPYPTQNTWRPPNKDPGILGPAHPQAHAVSVAQSSPPVESHSSYVHTLTLILRPCTLSRSLLRILSGSWTPVLPLT